MRISQLTDCQYLLSILSVNGRSTCCTASSFCVILGELALLHVPILANLSLVTSSFSQLSRIYPVSFLNGVIFSSKNRGILQPVLFIGVQGHISRGVKPNKLEIRGILMLVLGKDFKHLGAMPLSIVMLLTW